MTADTIRLPRPELSAVRSYLVDAVRRFADTAGIEPQALAERGEAVLLDLVAAQARDEALRELWGEAGTKPALPALAKSNGGAEREEGR